MWWELQDLWTTTWHIQSEKTEQNKKLSLMLFIEEKKKKIKTFDPKHLLSVSFWMVVIFWTSTKRRASSKKRGGCWEKGIEIPVWARSKPLWEFRNETREGRSWRRSCLHQAARARSAACQVCPRFRELRSPKGVWKTSEMGKWWERVLFL